jgi:antitoxin component of MazEF toxin-antitoxin module
MKTKIVKTGNSHGVYIHEELLKEAGLGAE